jgi:hypothetical protein
MALPKNVYAKHGAYYLVRNNKWIRLTDRLIEVPAALARLSDSAGNSREEIAAFAHTQLARSRANAKGRRGLEHTLIAADIDRMLEACDFRCSVTGVPYSLEAVGPRAQRPYAPSIDRKDNAVGYLADNCRLVCAAANIAMNTWGEEVLLRLMNHHRGRRVLDIC